MKIVKAPFLYFHERWWSAPEYAGLISPYPLFFPEGRQAFTLPELKEIVKEMEKMETANGSV